MEVVQTIMMLSTDLHNSFTSSTSCTIGSNVNRRILGYNRLCTSVDDKLA